MTYNRKNIEIIRKLKINIKKNYVNILKSEFEHII